MCSLGDQMASIQSKTSKNGKKVYYVVIPIGSKRKWIKAGSKQIATNLKRKFENLSEEKRIAELGLTLNETRIDDFFEKYIDHITLHTSKNTLKRYRSVIKLFHTYLKIFEHKVYYISQIRTETIESYQKTRLSSIELKLKADGDKVGSHKNPKLPKPQTVNYELSVLRSAFLWGKDREFINVIPTAKVKKLKTKGTREGYYIPEHERKLLIDEFKKLEKTNEMYRIYRLAFTFILNSGLRSGELCNLTWDDVDRGILRIQPKAGWTPKTYAREFYLNETCLNILDEIGASKGYIFVSVNGNQLTTDMLRNALIRVAKKVNLPHITRVHDLRHTFATELQMKGVDRATVAEIIGHESEKTTKIYSHTYKEHMKKAVNLVEM